MSVMLADSGLEGAAPGSARWTEDVRLAMAWNGGVSLAVWMGGVAVELDAARRARGTLDRTTITKPPERTSQGARTSDELYKAICLAFDRRLTIDILAGASAGGLNGALLAGAIVYDTVLGTSFLREKWIDIGDLSTLLQSLDAAKPGSVMQGQRFFDQVLEAFGELCKTPPKPNGELPVLLDVQVTDVVGEERCFWDNWEQPFYAREYRSPLRFRDWRDYRPGTLAAAARASASFPGAFEPQKLYGDAARIAGFEGSTRYAIDGGLLENAPIKQAIELLPRRRTNGPTSRFLCYVNAAPTPHQHSNDNPQEPSLAQVLGYTFNIPREARVVDQLLALDGVTQRAGLTADIGPGLLRLDYTHLGATAEALLPAYQVRRAIRSLEDLLGGTTDGTAPRRARLILNYLGEDFGDPALGFVRLPWIPEKLDVPADASGWKWGVRVAQRVMQLEIDLLTAALKVVLQAADADSILDARMEIERQLVFLDSVYDEFVLPLNHAARDVDLLDDESAQVREDALYRLTKRAEGANKEIWDSLMPATDAFFTAYRQLPQGLFDESGADLPSPAWLAAPIGGDQRPPEVRWAAFLARALAIEVIRRTFSDDFDIESAEALSVAQVTPMLDAPLLVFDARYNDVHGAGNPNAPRKSQDKLAGLRLNHFAGFYRSSWRENDFLWGRIDGASALARLLVDTLRAKQLHELYRAHDLDPPSQLARALTPDPGHPSQPGDADRVALLRELVPQSDRTAPQEENLETDLRQALEADLLQGDGKLTVAVCARALQYQVVREEIPHLIRQLDHDRGVGAHRYDLHWDLDLTAIGQNQDGELTLAGDTIMDNVVEKLRGASGPNALPALMGCDDVDEATSNLGLRTLSQTFLVGLSALAGVLPLSAALKPVRVPLLAVRGASAQRPLDRLAVVLGFAGASWYAVGRYITIPPPEHTGQNFPLNLLWSAPFLALFVSAVAVVGVVVVPGLRAVWTGKNGNELRRLGEGLFAVALLLSGGLLAALWIYQRNSFEEAVTTYHSNFEPPTWLLWVVVAAGGFQVASSLNSILKWAGPVFRAAGNQVNRLSIIFGGVGATLAIYAAKQSLAPALYPIHGTSALALLVLAAPIAVAVYLDLHRLTWRSLKAAVEAWKAYKTAHKRVNKATDVVSAPFRAAGRGLRKLWNGARRPFRRGHEPDAGDAIEDP
jgi:patatin-related protein